MIVFFNRHTFGYIFTNEKEVVDHVTKIIPLLCVNIIMDSLQGNFACIARGAGWQHLGVYVNLAAFYLVGIPLPSCCFVRGFHLTKRRGLVDRNTSWCNHSSYSTFGCYILYKL
ncbi:putative multi antimicrobial extrusion protein [Helianthus annuus]|nr:putative multi antimicrobial extrusion protein [Helianthus annuus]KAJ0545384.1 putative multi antimicrobial extrusion protein [Helianthus annuus]KAJ0721275.1 putative multi antimicrobial extrusion protein [Helianthus annuus]